MNRLDHHLGRRSGQVFWAYATSFGAAWGLLEFGLGSFLHNLRLPMGGQIMAMLGLVILLAQRQVLPRRGLSLATGLIAAACKVLSPGGIILGPMIAIPVEALIVELVLLAAPRAWLSAVAAGSLAALWPLSQKILTQFVYFGGDLISLVQALLLRSQRLLKLNDEHLSVLGLAALFVLMLLGGLSALLGRAIGQKLHRFEPQIVPDDEDKNADNSAAHAILQSVPKRAKTQPASWQPFLPHSLLKHSNKILASLALLSLFAWISQGDLIFAWVTMLFVGSLALLQPDKAQRLWMPRFWLWTLALVGLSALLLGPTDIAWPGQDPSKAFLSSAGLFAGLSMLMRALYVFTLSVWISGNISQQELIRHLRLLPLRHMGRAGLFLEQLGLAMLAAPALMRELALMLDEIKEQHVKSSLVDKLRWPYHLLTKLLHRAKNAAERSILANSDQTFPNLTHEDSSMLAQAQFAAIIADRAQGKTRTIFQIHHLLQEAKIPSAGLCQPAQAGRLAYDLVDLASQEIRAFARRRQGVEIHHDKQDKQKRRLGYLFDAEAWAWAESKLRQAWQLAELQQEDQVLLLDEMGRLEARGQGHMAVLQDLIKQSKNQGPRLIFIAVQKAVADEVKAQVGGFASQITLPAESEAMQDFVLTALQKAGLDVDTKRIEQLSAKIFTQDPESTRKKIP